MAREAYRVGSPGGCLRLGPAWARLSSPKADVQVLPKSTYPTHTQGQALNTHLQRETDTLPALGHAHSG